MHDLRKKALLESGKTLSKKAQSRQSSMASTRNSSAVNSTVNSRNVSAAVSRAGSDDEEGSNLSDETSFSVNSIDDIIANGDDNAPPAVWKADLADQIEEILDRKKTSSERRELVMRTYTRILTASYANDEIDGKEVQLTGAFLKAIKTEVTNSEAVVALKALGMTIVTSPVDETYEQVSEQLKRTITDSESVEVKTTAITTLGVATFYGGASDDEILDIMTFLLEIVSSDGHSINAPDEPEPVVAALEEWGFLATLVDDISDDVEETMEALVEQLNSSDAGVQIAAGENIALIYEKAYREEEDDEDDEGDDDSDSAGETPELVERFTPYRNQNQLIHTLMELANSGARSYSKKDRSAVRSNFTDILNAVENPGLGPKYRMTEDVQSRKGGSKLSVKINSSSILRINKWWKQMRLKGMRRTLQGGFLRHYESNSVVFDSLPILISVPVGVKGEERRRGKAGNRVHGMNRRNDPVDVHSDEDS